MNVSFYMPLKPLGHKNPSGDLITGRELYHFITKHGHNVEIASNLRSRWLYLRPWRFLTVALERHKIISSFNRQKTDIWLTYHTYYKAPDLLGPACCAKTTTPYAIFQGIYSTKRKRSLKTLPGFLLNRKALKAAHIVFTNKRTDEYNLKRLLPEEKIQYIAPGITPDQFSFDLVSRRALRDTWNTGERHVIMTAAMFRPGVKTTGIRKVIDSCRDLKNNGHKILLVVAGDGKNREILEHEGKQTLSENILFLGKIPRSELYRYYSASDIFAFPGIEESLGMVYLEAQSSGLPVVAFSDWGAKEAIIHNETGLLSSAENPDQFTRHIEMLLTDKEKRIAMRERAKKHIRDNHHSALNYSTVVSVLENIVDKDH